MWIKNIYEECWHMWYYIYNQVHKDRVVRPTLSRTKMINFYIICIPNTWFVYKCRENLWSICDHIF